MIGGRGGLKQKTTMFIPQTATTYTRSRRAACPRRALRHGQSIVIALLVLLLLGLVGALFVTVVSRNIINAAHSNRVQSAGSYASAGITYADSQLSSSIDGADWRPPLQFALAVPPTESRELARYTAAAASLPALNANDPDLEYLQAGYARYNSGAGRFLIRVTYDPVNVGNASVPPGKYLKIESVGREGLIDANDPTTYTNNRSSDKTQAYLVALKPIGITDYARFETNPDKRSDIANLGVASQYYQDNLDGGIATPGVFDFNSVGSASSNGGSATPPTLQEYPVLTTYGAADAYFKNTMTGSLYPNPAGGTGTAAPSGYTAVAGGGSVHSNMPVRFFGMNILYLNPGTNSPLFQDTAEFGGDLLLDSYNDKNPLFTTSATATPGQQAALILNPTNPVKPTAPATSTYVAPSNSTPGGNGGFSTQNGLVRDGSMQNDAAGLPRSITRLEPPLLDAQDAASQMPRYRAIAMNSAPRTDPTSTANPQAAYPATASRFGYGKNIYINNPKDVQPDSTNIGGGSTLTDEWLNRTTANATGGSKGGWNGLFYNPPGVTIVLGQYMTTPTATATPAVGYGIRLVQSAGGNFVDPAGAKSIGPKMDVPYSSLDTDRTGTSADNDIVIYAEGNVRVRGILSPNEGASLTPPVASRHITIVTGGTAYIEGNLLKGTPDSSISVLAHDYVCVNTTQFLAGPTVEEHTDGTQTPDLPQNSTFLSLDEGHSLLQEFNFGIAGTDATNNPLTPKSKYLDPPINSKLALYLAAGPESADPARIDINIFDPLTITAPTTPSPVIDLSSFTRTTLDLSSYTFPTVALPTGALLSSSVFTDLRQLSIKKDNGQDDANGVGTVPTAGQNVLLERAAILPMDIRIEAVLYAQTRSFFVIPGDWFNTNSNDNLKTYGLANTTPSRPVADNRFPLYGQPIDLKITISGSVSEAHPADIAAQTAWMQRWGWIPQYHGTLNMPGGSESAGHTLTGQPAIGLQLIYDPQAGYPYDPTPAGTGTPSPYYLRSDRFGRPLPFTPKLPVSPGLLYSGQSGESPLLQ